MRNIMNKKRLFLLDGSALVYRAFFAFQRNPLINSKGENTSAVFGFLLSLFQIIDEEKPDYIAAIFDTPEPTFRHKLYPEYKATREKMPDEMREQLPRLKQVIQTLNIRFLEMPGFEADDVMGTLAKTAEAANINVYLVTGDKDFMQLVTENIKIYNPKKINKEIEILDINGVKNKSGVLPKQIIELMSLVGDSSDNVPGVRGIGPKTGVKLIQEFNTLENLLKNLDSIQSKSIKTKIDECKEVAILSKELVTIDTQVNLDVTLDELKYQEPDTENIVQLLKKLEFTSLVKRFMKHSTTEEVKYKIIDTEITLTEFITNLSNINQFTLDLETTDIDPIKAQIVGFSFSWKKGEAYYIPVAVEAISNPVDLFDTKENKGLPVKLVLSKLAPIFKNEQQKKCGQNIKYDLLVLLQYDIHVNGIDFDTMVASYLINPSLRQHNLDALSLEHLNYQKIPTSDIIGKGKKQISMADVPIEKVAQYACEDADMTQRLRIIFEKKLQDNNLLDLLHSVELPLIEVLMDVENNGVSLDLPLLHEMSIDLHDQIKKLIINIYDLAGQEFNINSTKQLSDILFNKLGLPVIRRTKTGISTDVKVLEELAQQHNLPQLLLEYRQLAKLKSTYVDALPKLVNSKTGRVHTSYNQTVAVTGRLSSSNPNLQNIPIRTNIGRKIRQAFIPVDKHHVLLDADYSQIELRIMAHISQDETLIKSFQEDEDVHRRTASIIFNLPPEDVTDDLRRKAKEVNFGIMYGMGEYGLSTRLKITIEEARDFISDYFNNYKGVKEYIDKTIEETKDRGYVTTILHRRRYLPEINSTNGRVRQFAENNAVNTPIQGSAADLIKIAMINIYNRIKEQKIDAKMILQVHDELMFEVHKDKVDGLSEIVKYEMENAIELSVPLKVDLGIGDNWLEAH